MNTNNLNASSVGIIGMGWVGASVASAILHHGLCHRLLLNDKKEGLAEGEAMDLRHGSAYFPYTDIEAVSIGEMLEASVIVITAGRGGDEGESRLELLEDILEVAREISSQLEGYEGILIVVSNPVDVLTYFYQKYTGISPERVLGTGCMLDSSRLQQMLGSELRVNPLNIHAQVLGEHGDSEVIAWSSATVGSVSLRQWPGWDSDKEQRIGEQVKNAAQEIIKRKGATNQAIGVVTAALVRSILRNENTLLNVSSLHRGGHNLPEVSLSLPSVVGSNGVERQIAINLDDQEMKALKESAEVIKQAIDRVQN